MIKSKATIQLSDGGEMNFILLDNNVVEIEIQLVVPFVIGMRLETTLDTLRATINKLR